MEHEERKEGEPRQTQERRIFGQQIQMVAERDFVLYRTVEERIKKGDRFVAPSAAAALSMEKNKQAKKA